MVLRLAFMGTPDFAVPTLAELLAQGHDIAAVYSQPPRPKGRGMALEPGAVHKFAQSAGLAVHTPLSLKSPAEQATFAALELDAAVPARLCPGHNAFLRAARQCADTADHRDPDRVSVLARFVYHRRRDQLCLGSPLVGLFPRRSTRA